MFYKVISGLEDIVFGGRLTNRTLPPEACGWSTRGKKVTEDYAMYIFFTRERLGGQVIKYQMETIRWKTRKLSLDSSRILKPR